MKQNFKKIGAVLLSGAILFAFASCGKNETPIETDNASTTESTTAQNTTIASAETSTAEPTETQKPTENAKPTETQKPTENAKPTQTKPATTQENSKPTVKPTEKATEAPKPQKQAPKFIFAQSFPIKVTAYNAQFDVTKASVTGGYWSGDTYFFDLRVSIKRCSDGIDGKKTGSARIILKDSKNNIVRKTSIVAGSLAVGEEGSGLISWSVDAPGTYTVEITSI